MMISMAAALTLLPFLWMISTSLKWGEPFRTIPIRWIPQNPSLEAYRRVIQTKAFPFWQATFNSFFLAVTCTVVQVMSAAMAGFVFAKIPFRGKENLFLIYLITMMIPLTVTIIPSYTLLNVMRLTDTFTAIILLATNNAFGVFMMRQNMMAVNNAYIEATAIDGGSISTIFFRIMLPMVKPAAAAMALMAFMGSWNDYLKPLIILSSSGKQTLQLALATMSGQSGGKENILMAGAVLTIIPILVVYILIQKHIDDGLQIGGIKG